ncbi:MAG TPA: G1 family glutamic endopeptidase [Solirubrobacteraceae bacterium]|nr:G1 family glutamic endopeptidase [Solirubrobacteraceae bacterium]
MRFQRLLGPAAKVWSITWIALMAVGAASAEAISVSSNWAGYIASPSAGVGSRFERVSGTWTIPNATCSAGRESYSAVWVGLGGASEDSPALEQIGTDADCTSSGAAGYSSWYELVPAVPVELRLEVHPGDVLSASVAVRSHEVTLRMRDLSTGTHFSTTRRDPVLDLSSADWIVEAPSVCLSANACRTLALTDFGNVSFSSATATAAGHTGAIVNPAWSDTPLELRQDPTSGSGRGNRRRLSSTRRLITATPSTPPASGGSFSVSWQEQSGQLEQPPPPTRPGFAGVAPG